MSSLEVSDQEAEDVSIAPRVTLKDLEANVLARFDITPQLLWELLGAHSVQEGRDGSLPPDVAIEALKPFSLCILVTQSGFVLVGKSAPASPENFNAELGRKLAYEDCIRQLWPLMGYALKEKLREPRP